MTEYCPLYLQKHSRARAFLRKNYSKKSLRAVCRDNLDILRGLLFCCLKTIRTADAQVWGKAGGRTSPCKARNPSTHRAVPCACAFLLRQRTVPRLTESPPVLDPSSDLFVHPIYLIYQVSIAVFKRKKRLPSNRYRYNRHNISVSEISWCSNKFYLFP